jgi:fructokinase
LVYVEEGRLETTAIAHHPVRVICLGEILFDCLADELGKSLTEVNSWTSYPGGAPANVACALVKLGTPAGFIGCVGRDLLGEKLVELLDLIGVNTSGVQRSADFPTRQVYVLRSITGDRTFAGFGKHQPHEFADAYLQADKLPTKLFLEAEFLVVGTLELAYPQTRQAVFRALELADRYNLKVVLDVNRRSMFWSDESEALPLIQKLWKYIDYVKLAEEEARWLFDTADAGKICYHLNSVEGVLISNGDAKVSYCLSDNEGQFTPVPVTVKDTTGAGDAFLAGFIHQLCIRGVNSLNTPQTAREVIAYACAVGAIATTNSGAIDAQPTAAEVEAFLSANG